ncbi:MAG: hypothetical protein FWB77_02675 [Treponema sp.]|nr:hypothetical protein [Treponema sp.]
MPDEFTINKPTEAVEKIEGVKTHAEPVENKDICIRRGRVDSVSIYEVNESELAILENGSPNSIYLNFFTFLIATFLSFLSTLLTVDFSQKVLLQTIFIFIAVVSGFLSIMTFILWIRGKNKLSDVIKRIKNRII